MKSHRIPSSSSMLILVLTALTVMIPNLSPAEEDTGGTQTGWSFGPLPALGYSSDTGFLYGLLLQAYDYGDGSMFPDYSMTIQPTWSSTTKGNHLLELFFDSKYFIPWNTRITATAGYYLDQALPFYGFGGFQQDYTPGFTDKEDTDLFRTEGYYGMKREMSRLLLDFQHRLLTNNLRWIAGTAVQKISTGTVDFDALGMEEGETLFDELVQDGEIPADEVDGGTVWSLKAGLVFDSRDNEANPMSGNWTELIVNSTSLLPGNDFDYTQGTFTTRQYFTLIPRDMSIAARLGAQWTMAGRVPFFMQSFLQSSYAAREGLGGAKTLRGILMNRIVSENILYSNLELRWKLYRFSMKSNQFYIALNFFYDGGMALGPADDAWHSAYGTGVRLAMNENFIVAADFGVAANEQDGSTGLYIGMGYLY